MQRLRADIEQKFVLEGRVLRRYSGTEPKARLMVKGPGEMLITRYPQQLAAAIVAGCGAEYRRYFLFGVGSGLRSF